MALVRPTRGEVLRPGGLAGGGASAVYEALTDWIDLSQPIKDAWDAGPDNDPGNYHPDNAGDWTLTRTAGTPGTLTLAGTTGSVRRDGWNELTRFDLGAFATLLGVDSSILGPDVVVLGRSRIVQRPTGAGEPIALVQATNSGFFSSSEWGIGVAERSGTAIAMGSTTSLLVAVYTESAGNLGYCISDTMGNDAGASQLIAYGLADDGSVYGLNGGVPSDGTTRHPSSAATLWAGFGQWDTGSAAFTGFEFSIEARLATRTRGPLADLDF